MARAAIAMARRSVKDLFRQILTYQTYLTFRESSGVTNMVTQCSIQKSACVLNHIYNTFLFHFQDSLVSVTFSHSHLSVSYTIAKIPGGVSMRNMLTGFQDLSYSHQEKSPYKTF